MLPNKLIEAIKHIKENGCKGINCTECPLSAKITNEDKLCEAIEDLTPK